MTNNKKASIGENVLKTFKTNQAPVLLPSGEGRTYKAGNIILKHINKDSKEYWIWIANLFAGIKENGFRISKPIRSLNHEWVTAEGWSAWTVLEGNHDYVNHIPQIIEAIIAFHESVRNTKRPTFLEEDNPYIRADKYTWENKPEYIDPQVKEIVNQLYELRKPVEGLTYQLIHGDLNPGNILVSPNLSPAIIDIAPYWRPVEFALAIFAYWIGPWRNEPKYLNYFEKIRCFNQMLVRAGIRMLLIMSEFGKVTELEKYKNATGIISSFIKSSE